MKFIMRSQLLLAKINEYSYRILGPTTVHLHYELTLLICLTMLTASSLQGLYQESFGSLGDYLFLFAVVATLSRHLVIRWLATWDPSTNRSPTLVGLFSHFITAHLSVGQVFDRPIGCTKLAGVPALDDGKISIMALLPSSFLYAWQLIRINILIPLTRLLFGKNTDNSIPNRRRASQQSPSQKRPTNTTSKHEVHWLRRIVNYMVQVLHTVLFTYAPTLQFILPMATLAFYLYCFYYSRNTSAQEITWNLLTSDVLSRQVPATEEGINAPQGAYRRRDPLSWWRLFVEMTAIGEILCIMVFLRVIFPMPDLVAGSNVITDIRSEVRATISSKSTRATRVAKDNHPEAPWTERVRPITAERNRLSLTIRVVTIRVIENLYVCAFLPRTYYVCRFTGHCTTKLAPWELSRVLFPMSVTKRIRDDSMNWFGFMEWNLFSALWTIVGVTTVSLVLLMAHSLVTQKTYLSVLANIASEWTKVPRSQRPTVTPPAWDPRRKYKKDDLVTLPWRSSVFRACLDSPECIPSPLPGLTQLRTELGHPSTSRILMKLATFPLMVVGSYAILWALLSLLGVSTYGIFLAIMANLLAAHSLLRFRDGNLEELQRLNSEIYK